MHTSSNYLGKDLDIDLQCRTICLRVLKTTLIIITVTPTACMHAILFAPLPNNYCARAKHHPGWVCPIDAKS